MNQDYPQHDPVCPIPSKPDRTVEFTSEHSLAAFINALPGRVSFRVEERMGRPGWYILYFL